MLITHDLGIAAGMCDRINVMYAGRIVETGRVDDMFENPQMPYAWGLLDSLPRLDEERATRLRTIEGMPPDLDQPAALRAASARAAPTPATSAASASRSCTAHRGGPSRPLLRHRSQGGGSSDRTARAPARGDRDLVEVSDLKVYFPISAGIFQREIGRRARPSTASLRHPPGRDARPGGRVGLRQEHDRPGADPAPRADRGRGAVRRRRPDDARRDSCASMRRRMQIIFQDPYGSLEPADDGRLDHQRAARDAQPRQRRGARQDAGRASCCGWSASTRST